MRNKNASMAEMVFREVPKCLKGAVHRRVRTGKGRRQSTDAPVAFPFGDSRKFAESFLSYSILLGPIVARSHNAIQSRGGQPAWPTGMLKLCFGRGGRTTALTCLGGTSNDRSEQRAEHASTAQVTSERTNLTSERPPRFRDRSMPTPNERSLEDAWGGSRGPAEGEIRRVRAMNVIRPSGRRRARRQCR